MLCQIPILIQFLPSGIREGISDFRGYWRGSSDSPETLRKLCASTKFAQKEIR